MAGMQPDPTFLATLIEFGFEEQQAVRALRATGNKGIEQVRLGHGPLVQLPPGSSSLWPDLFDAARRPPFPHTHEQPHANR